MILLYTSDGLQGWNLSGKIVWCGSRAELYAIGWAHVAKRKDEAEFPLFIKDINYAIDQMVKHKHSAADFGIFGSFMYTYEEEELTA